MLPSEQGLLLVVLVLSKCAMVVKTIETGTNVKIASAYIVCVCVCVCACGERPAFGRTRQGNFSNAGPLLRLKLTNLGTQT